MIISLIRRVLRVWESIDPSDPAQLPATVAGLALYVNTNDSNKPYIRYGNTDIDLTAVGGGGTVTSVFTRTGAVSAVAGDYTASLITFTPSGDIAATNTQAAIVEVRDDTDTKLSGYQTLSEKGLASGYVGLDGTSKIDGTFQVYGTGPDTACEGNDARLSDDRNPLAHTHAASDVTSGTFVDARIAVSNVTQHQASLTITESQISDLSHVDPNAIHDNVASEISVVTEKVTPISGDFILIEDSAAGNIKKRVQIGNLPTGSGEANTGSNQGTDGVGVFNTKVGLDLQFRHIAPASSKVTVVLNTQDIDIDVVESNIIHDNLSGAGTNTHAQLDTHVANTTNPHATDIGNLGAGTLAELNTIVTDATLDTNTASRPPDGTASGDLGGTYPSPTVNDGADGSAVHVDIAAEISGITEKTVPLAADLLLIEDSAASNGKKYIQIGNLPINLYSNTISGVITGGVVTINGGDPALFDVSAGTGVITDWTDPTNPTCQVVTWGAFTAQTITSIATERFSSLYIDSAGALQQNGGAGLTPQQYRQNIGLQTVVHNDFSTITTIAAQSVQAYEVTEAILDYIRAVGVVNTGNVYAADATNLVIQKSSGTTTLPFINRHNDPQNSAILNNAAAAPVASFTYFYQDGLGDFTAVVSQTSIDPNQYDDGSGTLQTVSNNRWTIQRIYYFGQNNSSLITYGQAEYTSLASAELAIFSEAPVINPLFSAGSFTTALIVKKDVTDLSSSDAKFVEIISATGGGSSGFAADPNSIHNNVPAEISIITAKATPVGADVLLIEDSAAGFDKKSVTLSNLLAIGAPPNGAASGDLTGTYPSPTIATSAVTLAKMADRAQATLIGRAAGAGTGAPQELTTTQARTLLNVEDGSTADQSAAEVVFTPSGDIVAINVQTAIVEVRDDTDTKLSGKADTSHTHAASDVTSGTFVDARIAVSNVTQHQTSLSITESQISDLDHTDADAIHDNVSSEISVITAKATPAGADFLLIEDSAATNSKKSITITSLLAVSHNHTAGEVTSGTFVDARIAQSNVTQHQAALSITESQISDLAHTDTTAIHDNVSSEISVVTEKTTPVSGDFILIEDSTAGNVKKRVQIGNLPTGGGGEANTSTNQGTDGVGVFDTKSGVELQFRNVAPASARITVALNVKDIDIDVSEANLVHNSIGGLTTGDPHTQYALLAGRSGGQTLIGGTAASNNLVLTSTSHATKGVVQLATGSDLDYNDNSLNNIKRAQLNVETISSSSGVLDIDYREGNDFRCALTENVTSITQNVSGAPAAGKGQTIKVTFVQDTTARTLPASWSWVGYWVPGSAPTMPTGSGDILFVTIYDNGTEVIGNYWSE